MGQSGQEYTDWPRSEATTGLAKHPARLAGTFSLQETHYYTTYQSSVVLCSPLSLPAWPCLPLHLPEWGGIIRTHGCHTRWRTDKPVLANILLMVSLSINIMWAGDPPGQVRVSHLVTPDHPARRDCQH